MGKLIVVLGCGAFSACGAANQPQNFRGSGSVVNLQSSLNEMLQAAHTGGNTPAIRSIARIEARIAVSFQALPKNDVGRLAPLSVRYLVHNYFAKEHGWQIKGLEPQGMRVNVSDVQDVGILQERSPAMVEALTEAYRNDRGLDLADVAVMIAMLERLILDEATSLLYASYFLNGVSASDEVVHSELHEILRSYLLLVEMGMRGNLTDMDLHQEIKKRVAAMGKGWPFLVEFETDAVMSYDYETKDKTNPFLEEEFSFEEASHIVDTLAQRYGKWQQSECSRMKDDLMSMDEDGSGRIPLSTFYVKSNKREYQFTETLEYLRQIGAIDDTWKTEPRVRIANYVTGPSNCIASSKFYSVCCLYECDGVLNELEASIRAPAATPQRIITLASNLTSSSMLVPRTVSADLVGKLHSIAERNDGEVPLHGRLFAQWLHWAFPHECPFPHVSADGSELSAHHWLGGKAIATVEERANHVERVESAPAEESKSNFTQEWSDEEVLPLLQAPRRSSLFGVPVRVLVQVAMFLVVLRMVLGGCLAAANCGKRDTAKKGRYVLPV